MGWKAWSHSIPACHLCLTALHADNGVRRIPDYVPAAPVSPVAASIPDKPPSYLENLRLWKAGGIPRCQRCGVTPERPYMNEEEGWFCESPCWPIVKRAVKSFYDQRFE